MRVGYTLTEMVMATAVSAIVMAAVGSSFLAAQRMLKTSMYEAELSLAGRELREKLLFRAAPEIDGVTYAGVLSGTNSTSVVEGGANPNIQMSCAGIGAGLSDVRLQSMRIMLGGSAASRHLVNDRMPDKDAHSSWLWPGRFGLAESAISEIVGYDSSDSSASSAYRLYVDLGLMADDGVVRRERIAVPVFGRLQPFRDAGGRY